MNRQQKRRLFFILSLVITLAIAASLILYALKQNINLFYTPTQLLHSHISTQQSVRIGGYVKNHSVKYDNSGKSVSFVITDNENALIVMYQGVLPNLFREGQGVVVTGKVNSDNTLIASEVLAKHDEKYTPWPLRNELKDMKKNDFDASNLHNNRNIGK